MSKPEEIHKLLVACTEQLVDSVNIIRETPLEPIGENLRRIGRALAEISDLRTELYKTYPQLKPAKWGESLEEADYKEMYEDAIAWAAEYIQAGNPKKGVEVLEKFISITPHENIRAIAEKKVKEMKDEFAL